MDAPNIPNPANQNTQDQDQVQIPVGQAPAQGPKQFWSKCTCPTNTTTGPNATGPCWCHPGSSDILSKLDREETRISGKPEEDAESHLLSARDWIEAHNFTEGEKVRHFQVTLIGEARLWYGSLALLDNDWPTLQNKFRVAILQNR